LAQGKTITVETGLEGDMFSSRPGIDYFLDAPWEAYEPYYQDLSQRTLDEENIHQWLLDWTWVRDLFLEVTERLYVAYNQDTADKAAYSRYHTFVENVYPPVMAAEQQLKLKLLKIELEPPGFEIPLRNMRAEAAIYHEDNLPLKAEEKMLVSEYERITGGQCILWDGHEFTIPQLIPHYLQSNREVRKQMWQLVSQRQLKDRKAINDLWQRFMDLRGRIASNAGLSDYRAYMWEELLRFDYTPDDCFTFHNAIEKVVVPAATRIYEKRRQKMGLNVLRPWDLDLEQGVYTFYIPPLKPYSDPADLAETASRMFYRLDPQFGNYFQIMREEDLLDLQSRKGKAPGAYCTPYYVSKRPFIFMNAAGTHDDVQTLLHEFGHAIHVFETCDLPYSHQRKVGEEFGEVASMAMELLSAPFLPAQEGGYYSFMDTARARMEHLERSLLFWPYMAVVDAFQHWVYTNHAAASDPNNCDEKWDELWNRFIPGVDWSGLEDARRTGWQRKIHIHTNPFYYIEYGFSQLGAMQIWRNSVQDQAGAVCSYRTALSLGGTVTIPELYRAAGAHFAFDAGLVEEIVGLMERTISELEDQNVY
jgi:oligoendopeptidase F